MAKFARVDFGLFVELPGDLLERTKVIKQIEEAVGASRGAIAEAFGVDVDDVEAATKETTPRVSNKPRKPRVAVRSLNTAKFFKELDDAPNSEWVKFLLEKNAEALDALPEDVKSVVEAKIEATETRVSQAA